MNIIYCVPAKILVLVAWWHLIKKKHPLHLQFSLILCLLLWLFWLTEDWRGDLSKSSTMTGLFLFFYKYNHTLIVHVYIFYSVNCLFKSIYQLCVQWLFAVYFECLHIITKGMWWIMTSTKIPFTKLWTLFLFCQIFRFVEYIQINPFTHHCLYDLLCCGAFCYILVLCFSFLQFSKLLFVFGFAAVL